MNTLITKYQQFFTADWIVTALAILAYNVTMLLTVLDYPVPKFSSNVLQVQQLSLELDEARKQGRQALAEAESLDLGAIFNRYLPKLLNKITSEPIIKRLPSSAASATPAQKKKTPPLVPLKVTGIYHVSDKAGENNALVLIHHKYYRINEKVKGFTIKEITAKGVVFVKDGANWFVPAPKGPYSITLADES